MTNRICFLAFTAVVILSCNSSKKMELIHVSRKESNFNNDSSRHIIRDYYVIKNFKRDLSHIHIVDSIALAVGRSYKFKNFYYSINFYKATTNLKNDSVFFNKSDSLALSQQRQNLFNYMFWGNMFRDKETIENKKIVPTKRQVSIKNGFLKIDLEPVQ